jgi:gliding motility-associated-like protein
VFTYVYDDPRVYNARLVITDVNGCRDSVSRPIGVGGPRARFFAANPTGCVGLTVNFADSSLSDGANAIVSRVWDFGDGAIQTINSPPVSHQYTTTGFFNVKLRVTDAVGCTDSLVRNSFVVASSPRAAFSSPDTLSCPGRNVQFLTQSTGAFNAGAHFWNFGDGRTSNLNNPQNAYARAGRYDVRLRVTDRFGCSDSIFRTQYITIDTPFAAFDISDGQATCPPLIATFYNRSRYQASQRWDFGDGDISVLPDSPIHVYNVPGTYVSRLVITSPGGCTDTAFRTITIFGPNGTISASSPTAGCVPLTVNLSVRTTNTDSVTWIYGDGTVEFGRDTVKTHTYTKAGDAILEVFLKDSTGCRVPIRFASPIRVIGITPGFDSDKKLLCDNGSISFADTTRTNGVIQAWDWDFGDGTLGSGPTPSHFYNSTGFYDVKLRITTEFGCTDSVTVPRYIKSVASPVAGIASSDTACQNRFITYRGNILQPDTSAVRWAWNFANGNTSTLQNPPTQQYLVPGSLTVQLLVTNSSGCVDTVTRDIRIHPLPLVDAGADSTICLGQSVSLNATGASTYQWLLPNSSLSCTNCGDPVATPASSITYRVRGTSVDGCQVDDSVRVIVVQPSRVQAPPNDSLCLGQGMQLFASGTQVYRWSPATGLNNPNTASPIARPTTTTTYVVTGSDARGCFVTLDSVTISVFPIPIFDLGPDVTIPVGSSVRFTPRISGNIVSVRWSPTTGLSCTDCQDPVASPRQKTQYTVTAVNNGGCTITDQITVFVTCSGDNLFIPNTFSPNGDGMNDVFYPRGRGILEIRSIKVFNRWGQQVYWRNNIRANDASQGWDGTFKGTALNPDVYVYMVDVVCENNSVLTLKGDVMLVR